MSIQQDSQNCLNRIVERLQLTKKVSNDDAEFLLRLGQHFPRLYELLCTVYEYRDDMEEQLFKLVQTLVRSNQQRPKLLKKKDKQRIADPQWYQSEKLVGMACYVDLMADDLVNLKTKIPYLVDLGITYLHLMPLYKSPEGDSDGGYAVSDYRTVNPSLGTMDDLRDLANELEEAGISLVMDFVFNHTSDEHEWAKAARKGDPEFRDYYYIYDDRSVPDAYEKTLREIFPQVRRGSFTQLKETGQWVWTTFNNFQWDLNYSNPTVFTAIVDEMLFLANVGCDVLRLDALAFIWKEMGTDCENRPNAHKLIQAFNSCLQISAPAVVFKSEAIVHPDYVVQYISPQECQLSYNPLLMAMIWNSLATRKTRLMTQSLSHRFAIHPDCSWVNYARCHDDIGWTFDDGDAAALGINGYDHRQFLNRFYTGQHEGSFATGMGFQFNPETGDCRVCGSLASLAGLELAEQLQDEHLVDMAIRRILLIHSVILSIGGVALLYAGDELAMYNDYSFKEDEHKRHDERWVNRPRITAQAVELAQTPGTVQNRVHQGLRQLIQLRNTNPIMGDAKTHIVQTNNVHVFGYLRQSHAQQKLLALCNFSDHEQQLDAALLQQLAPAQSARDLASGADINLASALHQPLKLEPYQFLWLSADAQ
ncbi:MAG: amylosucrase [Gammaproteobacteria bacterium]|uniref:amylosucrase n=1 Tax=Pseudomaricurvus alcaniphilus TaxID=1166482 RepID=UPI001408F495|nr:amylosucrase [Pseudomaricurvus alcaniphilus]MBR9912275.1 amylosucrase [Gammaproteobacteria bacterium]NHN37338.1 amylosucrase [Pseudomaricurvus alcaniphilus]